MRAGKLRDRARFERLPSEAPDADDTDFDAYGEPIGAWEELVTEWADLRETPGKEALAAGRLESTKTGTLRVRASTVMKSVSAADRVVVRGLVWNIQSGPVQIDRVGAVLEFTLEHGGADGEA